MFRVPAFDNVPRYIANECGTSAGAASVGAADFFFAGAAAMVNAATSTRTASLRIARL